MDLGALDLRIRAHIILGLYRGAFPYSRLRTSKFRDEGCRTEGFRVQRVRLECSGTQSRGYGGLERFRVRRLGAEVCEIVGICRLRGLGFGPAGIWDLGGE